MLNKRELGSEYETRACKFLEDKGYSIIERNFYSKHNEIDIIARDKEYLVFIEVKYRRDNTKGTPLDAVNYSKRKNILENYQSILNHVHLVWSWGTKWIQIY